MGGEYDTRASSWRSANTTSRSRTTRSTNALIQADTLGIFAREGLDLATRWPLGNDGDLIGDAFRIYRNYDGQGSQFGDIWIRSTSSNQDQLAIYGARRTSDGAITVLVINKSAAALTSPLALSGIASPDHADTWSWTGQGITHAASTPIRSNAIDATYPPMSMTLYVIAPVGSPTQPPGGSGAPSGGSGGAGGAAGGPSGRLGLPSDRIRLARSRAGRSGTILLWVRAPGAGRLTAAARTTTRARKRHTTLRYGRAFERVARAGTIPLAIKPNSAARKLLRRHRKLMVRITLTFIPSGGPARILTTVVAVKAASGR